MSVATCLAAKSRLRAADPAPSTVVAPSTSAGPAVLKPAMFQHYIEAFNQQDRETVISHIPNAAAWGWLTNNIPPLRVPRPRPRRDLLLPVVDLSQTHQAHPGRLHHHRVSAARALGGEA
ncbi:MAG: hypothetical protein M5U12_11395 [Verrucomicrobia bacterium]|nr:hypothetical protein [Verrucomicrobiota bacterium]